MNQPKLTPTFADQLAAGQAPVFQPASPIEVPTAPPKRTKVAIIGTAPSSRGLAPFADMEWDIWGCSPGNMQQLPRVDAWFEVHANLLWPEYADAYGKNYIEWLSKQPFPVYLQDEPWHQKYFPHGIKFPARDLVKRFGHHWFSSSFAWMMAFAIFKGQYKEIGLFGVDMASKDEYIQQRQAFYRWLEFAADHGIKVTIPRESDLAQKPSLYGFSDATHYGRKLHARGSELKGRSEGINQEIQRATNQVEQLKANKLYIDGAREDNEYQSSIWMSLGDEWGEIKLADALEVVKEAGYQVSKPEPVSSSPELPKSFTTSFPFGPVLIQPMPEPSPPPVVEAQEVPKRKRKLSNGQRRADHG